MTQSHTLSSMIFDSQVDAIGGTPLVRINQLFPENNLTVLAKIESRNPAFSVKCRIGASMVQDAEASGKLKAGMTIVEPTSGNTGIALAFVGASKGYKVMLTMPSSMSLERRKVLKALGAELVLTDPALGMKGAVDEAFRLSTSEPEMYFMPSQFDNPANPAIHVATTAPEIWQATEGKVDVLVAGVGTGGTISGIAEYFKEIKQQPLYTIAVEPAESPIISQTLRGEPIKPAPHKIQGIGANFIPKNLKIKLLDEVITVTSEEAIEYARLAMTQEGILCGISSGGALAGVAKLQQREEFKGKTIVVILPDSGERYLSTALFDGMFTEKELG